MDTDRPGLVVWFAVLCGMAPGLVVLAGVIVGSIVD